MMPCSTYVSTMRGESKLPAFPWQFPQIHGMTYAYYSSARHPYPFWLKLWSAPKRASILSRIAIFQRTVDTSFCPSSYRPRVRNTPSVPCVATAATTTAAVQRTKTTARKPQQLRVFQRGHNPLLASPCLSFSFLSQLIGYQPKGSPPTWPTKSL